MLVGANFVFPFLLRAPTKKGRVVLDEIEGFKKYLGGDGTGRFDLHSTPEEIEKRFERYLPYAIALDQSAPWAEEFTRALSSAGSKAAGAAAEDSEVAVEDLAVAAVSAAADLVAGAAAAAEEGLWAGRRFSSSSSLLSSSWP